MSDIDQPGLSIEVAGPPDSGKTVVCTIITRALDKAGFTNVNMVDQQGEIVVPGEPRNLLEALAMTRPELLAQPIEVIETTVLPEEEEDVPEEVLPDEPVVADSAVLEEFGD